MNKPLIQPIDAPEIETFDPTAGNVEYSQTENPDNFVPAGIFATMGKGDDAVSKIVVYKLTPEIQAALEAEGCDLSNYLI